MSPSAHTGHTGHITAGAYALSSGRIALYTTHCNLWKELVHMEQRAAKTFSTSDGLADLTASGRLMPLTTSSLTNARVLTRREIQHAQRARKNTSNSSFYDVDPLHVKERPALTQSLERPTTSRGLESPTSRGARTPLANIQSQIKHSFNKTLPNPGVGRIDGKRELERPTSASPLFALAGGVGSC